MCVMCAFNVSKLFGPRFERMTTFFEKKTSSLLVVFRLLDHLYREEALIIKGFCLSRLHARKSGFLSCLPFRERNRRVCRREKHNT